MVRAEVRMRVIVKWEWHGVVMSELYFADRV
jgi:hypothetical protein